jgi:aldehyde dehydrogenase
MPTLDSATIEKVVVEVIGQLQGKGALAPKPNLNTGGSRHGVYADAVDAARAARAGFEQLKSKGWEGRAKVIEIVKTMCRDEADRWGRIEFEETKIGRLEHKVAKLHGIQNVLGTEFLNPHGMSGDAGITLDEAAPWGVVAAITPVTHSVPTIAGNIVNMVAAGNAVVVNPHPGGAKVAALAIHEINEAIRAELGIENLICTVEQPSLESFEALCGSPDVAILCITGGPAVVQAAMQSGKRSICAGPGNPPVVVDDCSCLDFRKIAKDIILGGGFDNNLLCIGEKQVFTVGPSHRLLVDAMQQEGAVLLTSSQLDKIRSEVFTVKDGQGGGCSHAVLNRDYVGADAAKLAAIAGLRIDPKTEMLVAETAADDLFVEEEQMMPLVPIVQAKDFEAAVALAKESEHGYRHSAMIHTMNVARMSFMGREMDTTLFVKNGPCVAGLGMGGEGFISFSIATTTGEGITTPRTFTRFRRCTLVDQLNII